jgi:hypothetical protein
MDVRRACRAGGAGYPSETSADGLLPACHVLRPEWRRRLRAARPGVAAHPDHRDTDSGVAHPDRARGPRRCLRRRLAPFAGPVAEVREQTVDDDAVVLRPIENIIVPTPWLGGGSCWSAMRPMAPPRTVGRVPRRPSRMEPCSRSWTRTPRSPRPSMPLRPDAMSAAAHVELTTPNPEESLELWKQVVGLEETGASTVGVSAPIGRSFSPHACCDRRRAGPIGAQRMACGGAGGARRRSSVARRRAYRRGPDRGCPRSPGHPFDAALPAGICTRSSGRWSATPRGSSRRSGIGPSATELGPGKHGMRSGSGRRRRRSARLGGARGVLPPSSIWVLGSPSLSGCWARLSVSPRCGRAQLGRR